MADDELKEALKEHYSGDIVDILSESLDHTIEERNDLIGMCNRLKAENDKLREELRQWERLTANIELPEYPVTEFQPKDLERENAKLRELVRQMSYAISPTSRERMLANLAEQGIEVDG